MKLLIFVLLFVSAIAMTPNEHHWVFQKFIRNFNKTYSEVEYPTRMANFIYNLGVINEHNKNEGNTHRMGLNQFSDMSHEEFRQTVLCMNMDQNAPRTTDVFTPKPNVGVSEIDWTTKGAVTPVKNQGECGSCWAFSTTGAMEGMYAQKGSLPSLSEQMLVSCDKVDSGCNGGLPSNAFEWIESNGLCSESDYPYTSGSGSTGTCKTGCSADYKCSGYTKVSGGEDGLAQALQKMPISIGVDANSWQHYSGGVLSKSDCSGRQLDHGVLLVGIVKKDGQDVYKVKNSWASSWGEDGFIYLPIGIDCCMITYMATYPKA